MAGIIPGFRPREKDDNAPGSSQTEACRPASKRLLQAVEIRLLRLEAEGAGADVVEKMGVRVRDSGMTVGVEGTGTPGDLDRIVGTFRQKPELRVDAVHRPIDVGRDEQPTQLTHQRAKLIHGVGAAVDQVRVYRPEDHLVEIDVDLIAVALRPERHLGQGLVDTPTELEGLLGLFEQAEDVNLLAGGRLDAGKGRYSGA